MQSKFGEKVSELVKANSSDETIKGMTDRCKENLARCMKTGKNALIIKAADFLDNSNYYHLASSDELEKWLIWKLGYFIENSRDVLKNEALYAELKEKHDRIMT